jgi:hypothetical protein
MDSHVISSPRKNIHIHDKRAPRREGRHYTEPHLSTPQPPHEHRKYGRPALYSVPRSPRRWLCTHYTQRTPLRSQLTNHQLWGVAASCCGAATCSAVCSSCGKCGNSIATRIAYALILLINSIVSWIMLTDWAMKKLSNLTLSYVDIMCHGEQCYGYVAVQRINFALGLFHILMAVMLVGVRSSKDGRAPIQNGFWGPKVVAWIGLVVMTFFIPNTFFIIWGNYFAMVGACLFLLVGLILLVDLAHNWAEYCQEKIEVTESRAWTGLLVGSAVFMYLSSFAMTVVMYIYFAKSGCGMNQAAITVRIAMRCAGGTLVLINSRSTSYSSLSLPSSPSTPPSKA